MVEQSFPFSGTSPGDAGPYSATFFAQIVRAFLGQELTADASIISQSGDGATPPLEVTQTGPASAQVRIRQGDAIVRGYYYRNDATPQLNVTISSNVSGNPRIDTIILEIDFTAQQVRAGKVEGTPAGSPVAPTLTQDGSIWQVPLSDIAVANGFSTIEDVDIDNSVAVYARNIPVEEGGTGIETIAEGDILAGGTLNTLGIIPTVAVSGSNLVGDLTQSPKYRNVDKRITQVYKASNTSFEAIATPIPIDGMEDLAGNMRAVVSASRFYPGAGTFKIDGWILAQNFSTSVEQQFFLYDTNAAADVVDINGERVQSLRVKLGGVYISHRPFFPTWVTFDGTEIIEIRALATTNWRYDSTVTPYRPVVLNLERMF